jgi:dihydropyrimidinase
MAAESHYGAIGYNPFEGFDLTGWPVLTVRRGAIAVRDGAWLGRAGEGRFLTQHAP